MVTMESVDRQKVIVSMAYTDFQDFLAKLEREGELKRIKACVDPYLEITEVADRVMKMPGGGPALLFENPKGSTVPLAINVFGSRKRMSMALGVNDIEDIACEIAELLKPEVPTGLLNAARELLRFHLHPGAALAADALDDLRQLIDLLTAKLVRGPDCV